MLPKQIISFKTLKAEGFRESEIKNLFASLKIFPTPFKGIYYVPLDTERKGNFIERPLSVLSRAIEIYLGSREFYYSCQTAEEFLGLRWQPSNEVHIVNTIKSKRIDLHKRIIRNNDKGTYRSKKMAALLSSYGDQVIFHRTQSIKECKIKNTPYGRYATKPQIKQDKEKFRC